MARWRILAIVLVNLSALVLLLAILPAWCALLIFAATLAISNVAVGRPRMPPRRRDRAS
jgi:hypothetical protein